MKKRMLIIHHGRGLGGGLIALLGIIRELKLEYDVTVFTIFNSEANEYIKNEGVSLIENNSFYYQKLYRIFSHSAASYNSILKFVLKFYNLINFIFNKYFYTKIVLRGLIKDYDIVYLNSTFISDWAYYPKKKNKKVFIHVREPLKTGRLDFFSAYIRYNIKNFCDHIIAISHDNAHRINLMSKTTVIYDSVINDLQKKNNPIILDNNYKYFVYVGGGARIKGFEQIVNCLSMLSENIKVIFIGNYSPVKKLDSYYKVQAKLFKKLEQSRNSVFVGKSNSVLDYMEKSIANISPFSKPHAALPILESFSMGIPVIVSNVQGMDELVDNLQNGLIFENNNPADLASKINYLASLDENELILFRDNSRRKYSQIKNSSSSLIKCLMAFN